MNTANMPINPVEGPLIKWWYHVVPIIKLNDDQLYVFDPSLSTRPMTTNSFYETISVNEDGSRPPTKNYRDNVRGKVTCLPNTYNTAFKCFDPKYINLYKVRAIKQMQEKIQLFLTM